MACVDWRSAPPGRLSPGGMTGQTKLSTREFKKFRLQFYSDTYAEWERKNLGEVKVSLGGIPRAESTASGAV
jgi:hypothetical protein